MFSSYPSFFSLSFISLLFQACTGLQRKADVGLLFFLFTHTFLPLLSPIVVFCRLNEASGIERAVAWRWCNCVPVCICFCVQGAIASIICPHSVMCAFGDFFVLFHLFVLHINFFYYCLACPLLSLHIVWNSVRFGVLLKYRLVSTVHVY